MEPEPIRLLIADDHPVTRAGIRTVLSAAPDICIVGEAQNGQEVQALVSQLHPRILLLDLRMPETHPAEIECWVRTHVPETITLVLTAHDHDAYLSSMMEAGAAGFLAKSESAERLSAAIRRAASGEILFDDAQWVRAYRWRRDAGEKWESLTERERQALKLLAQGLSNKAIAEKLCVTSKTVAYHITNILSKLGVASRQEAAAWAHAHLPVDLEKIPG
ncbi:MAG TPA: response regulator transcription factor [Anaerolineae bacterium]|nr:response regulator transcription factor [Anaerolineae bacterium]